MKENKYESFFKEIEEKDENLKKWGKWYEQEREIIKSLHKRRIELGYSQKQVADMIGLKQPAIARIENEVNSPQLSTLIKYADALNLELDLISDKIENIVCFNIVNQEFVFSNNNDKQQDVFYTVAKKGSDLSGYKYKHTC